MVALIAPRRWRSASGTAPVAPAALRWALSMDAVWSALNGRALAVSVAHDAFNFEISWLGVVLVSGAMLVWRHLRR
jgi:hypothetical protein